VVGAVAPAFCLMSVQRRENLEVFGSSAGLFGADHTGEIGNTDRYVLDVDELDASGGLPVSALNAPRPAGPHAISWSKRIQALR
jgi:hypothetical protein